MTHLGIITWQYLDLSIDIDTSDSAATLSRGCQKSWGDLSVLILPLVSNGLISTECPVKAEDDR